PPLVARLFRSPDMDVLFSATPDGGEISITNNLIDMDAGLETAVYLSLFGGNSDDDATDETTNLQWWGNLLPGDSQLPLRCRTQFLIRDLPATTGNLARLRDAAIRDLAWVVDSFADSYKVDVSMPALNRVALRIDISIGDQTYTFIFDEHWGK